MRAALLLVLLLAAPAAADELQLEAAALYDQSITSDLELSENGRAFELGRGQLIEDDGPAAGYVYDHNVVDTLQPGAALRKELIIDQVGAESATLLVAPGGKNLELKINNQQVELGEPTKIGHYWQADNISTAALRPGKNELIFRGEGKLWIARDQDYAAGSRTRTKHPNRSAKSTDDGRTWKDRQLGDKGDLDGEYYVRLMLDQHVPQGELITSVFDAGNLFQKQIAPPLESLSPVHLTAVGQFAGDQLAMFVRTGSTYVVDDQWSDWQPLEHSSGQAKFSPSGRFLQLKFVLQTTDPARSPRLEALTLTSKPARAEDWTTKLKVLSTRNPQLVRSAIPFEYEPADHPDLKRLREEFELDKVVAGADSEMEIAQKLAVWSSSCWDRVGHIGKFYPPWKALEILKPYEDGKPTGGFCQQYNLVFLQACESFGLVGRVVSIGSGQHLDKIRSGHETVELWSNEHQKWFYIDGNTAWYAIDPTTGVPLSMLELRDRQLDAFAGRTPAPFKVVELAATRHKWPGLTSWPPFIELRLIPRSNFLEQASPLPLNQGMRGWFWTGHYVWTDDREPARPLYGQRINKRANFEWAINTVHLYPLAQAETGHLQVYFDSDTPNFAAYVVHVDGEELATANSQIAWKLKPGRNRITVQARNSGGWTGPESHLEVEYTP